MLHEIKDSFILWHLIMTKLELILERINGIELNPEKRRFKESTHAKSVFT